MIHEARNIGREAPHDNMKKILHALAEAVNRAGHNTVSSFQIRHEAPIQLDEKDTPGKPVPWHYMSFKVDDVELAHYIEFNSRYVRKRYNEWETVPGEYDLMIGDYGDRQRFPLRKDGTHAFDKAAPYLIRASQRAKFAERQEEQRTKNQNTLAEFGNLVPVLRNLRFEIRPTSDPVRPVNLSFSLRDDMTVSEARAIIGTLKPWLAEKV